MKNKKFVSFFSVFFKRMRRFSNFYANFNHFQTKLCQTKPIYKMLKMNITNYMTRDYRDNLQLSPTKKQSQTNPIYSVFIRVNSWLNSKQTQTNPILSRAKSRDLSKQLSSSGGFRSQIFGLVGVLFRGRKKALDGGGDVFGEEYIISDGLAVIYPIMASCEQTKTLGRLSIAGSS
jgi:hypothetical protein